MRIHDCLRKNKLYKFYCDKCNNDRGYKPKNYKSSKCNSCAQKGKTLSLQDKANKSIASMVRYNDPNWKPKEIVKVGHKNRKKRTYSRKNSDLQNKCKDNVRRAIWQKLKKRQIKTKNGSTFSLLGYTLIDLIEHLESKFQQGMNWSNWGRGEDKWHIDHIIPDSWFNYVSTSDDDFKKSWELNNLQPMWEIDNLSKGARSCQKA